MSPQAASRKPQAASRKPQAASRKPQAASRKPQAASRKPQARSVASPSPDARTGLARARGFFLPPVLALLLGAFCLFVPVSKAVADHTFPTPSNIQVTRGSRTVTISWDAVPNAGNYLVHARRQGVTSYQFAHDFCYICYSGVRPLFGEQELALPRRQLQTV